MSAWPGGNGNWNRRALLSFGGRLLTAGATGLGAAACGGPADPPPDPRTRSAQPASRTGGPNIVLVVLDDAGYGDFGPQHKSLVRTPRLSGLAAGGMHFMQMYAGASVCTPSRAALMTGRYAPRVGLPHVLSPADDRGISRYERTVAELLREAGYRTGIFGKWHLGSQPRHNPLFNGFDRYFGLLHSNDQRPLHLYEDRERLPGPVDQRTLTRRYTDEAISFIEQHRREPFFVYMPHTAPHIPLHVEQDFEGTSMAGRYGDALEAVDFHIGRLLDRLDELGLRENTLVMVTSDNGPWFEGSTGGLRGRKVQAYEGGVRVPLLLRWPDQVAAKSVCPGPASFLDVMPTLVNLVGGSVPTDRPIDGLDIGQALRDQPVPRRKAFYFFDGWTIRAVRSGRWKLHLPARRPHRSELRQLHDLDIDPGEQYDRSHGNPDVVERLTELASRFDHEISAVRPEAIRRARAKGL